MANWYIWSGAVGGGTGADWTNAYVNLTSISTKAAGDNFFVAHDHIQTVAGAMLITSPGTEALPCRIYCVNRLGSVPPVVADLRTTAQVSTTGANNISLAGTIAECYGIIFSAGDAANAANIALDTTGSRFMKLSSCALKLNNTATTSRITSTAAGGNVVVFDNVTVQFGSVSQTLNNAAKWIWRNTPNAILGPTIPTTLLSYGGSGSWYLEGVDLSAMIAGKTICSTASTSIPMQPYVLKDCKLGGGPIMATPTGSIGGPEAIVIRSDSVDTNYRTEKYNYSGNQIIETTIVYGGGASDGGQPISWKITTSANSELEYPFECLPITIWNDTTGSTKTVTIQGVWGTASLPKNDDIWIDVEHLGTSGFPLGVVATSGKGIALAANADCPAGSGTWGGSTTKFAMSATFTAQKKGPLTIYVRAAKPSSIFYIDPKPVIT